MSSTPQTLWSVLRKYSSHYRCSLSYSYDRKSILVSLFYLTIQGVHLKGYIVFRGVWSLFDIETQKLWCFVVISGLQTGAAHPETLQQHCTHSDTLVKEFTITFYILMHILCIYAPFPNLCNLLWLSGVVLVTPRPMMRSGLHT